MALLGGRIQHVVIECEIPISTRIEIEASVSESHRRSAEVTAHPVERGADVVDHIRFNPRELDMVGVISNTPIMVAASLQAQPSVPGGDPRSRAEDAYRELENLMEAGALCKITTTLFSYEDMALVALSTPRDAPRGNIAELQMTWREVRFAETLRVDAPVPSSPARGNNINAGKQAANAAKDAEAEKATSLLSKIKVSLGF
jgi:hypothetical protein